MAGSAAVLSFASLRGLAVLCGFASWLAWLLPVVLDAGAAAGCLVWLGAGSTGAARRFARSLTVVLLASSVAGNAVVHGLTVYRLTAPVVARGGRLGGRPGRARCGGAPGGAGRTGPYRARSDRR